MNSPDLDFNAHCQNYAYFFERLSPTNLSELENLCAQDVLFQDPFNRIQGIENLRYLFQDMFAQTHTAKFTVYTFYPNPESRQAILKWRFEAATQKIGTLDFDGLSEIQFDEQGKVISHIDYWDSGSHFYTKIPVLGFLIRLIKRRLSLS